MKKKKSLTKRQFLFLFLAIVVLLAVVRHLPQLESASVYQVSVVEPTVPHRILSVPNYKQAFPDSQSVQIVAAERWGVRPVKNREDAEKRKKELVYIGESPYWHVDRLSSSIPYLVPRAALLLQDIGQAMIVFMSRVSPFSNSSSPVCCAPRTTLPVCSAITRMLPSVHAISLEPLLISATIAIIPLNAPCAMIP